MLRWGAAVAAAGLGGLWWYLRTKDEEEEDETWHHVYRIVLTGGPCAGKTTALARLSGFLQERGFRVYTVPEMATMLFTNGVAFSDLGSDPPILSFQKAVLDGQLALEDGFARVAAATKSPAVLLCDRATMDGSAYMSPGEWTKLLESRKHVLVKPKNSARRWRRLVAQFPPSPRTRQAIEQALCERYDAVFHLVTAAAGAERFYSLANNAARSEAPESAREADRRTQRAWAPHPRQIVFDNSAGELGFEGKLQRVVEATAKLVGLPVLPKSTRKFMLLALPPSVDVFAQHHVNVTSFKVTKTFLKHSTSGTYSYVRARWQEDDASYGHVTVHVDPVTNEKIERKRRCSPREYAAHLDNADPDRVPVQQQRLHFLFEDQSFVIHRYFDRDLAIIHCQAARQDGSVDFPPFLQVGEEISDKASWSAYHLSQLGSGDSQDGAPSLLATTVLRANKPVLKPSYSSVSAASSTDFPPFTRDDDDAVDDPS